MYITNYEFQHYVAWHHYTSMFVPDNFTQSKIHETL